MNPATNLKSRLSIKLIKNKKGITSLSVNGKKVRGEKADNTLDYYRAAQRVKKAYPIYEIPYSPMQGATKAGMYHVYVCDYAIIKGEPFIVDLTAGTKSQLLGYLYAGDGSTGLGDGTTFKDLLRGINNIEARGLKHSPKGEIDRSAMHRIALDPKNEL